jgi:hypothetical protein
VLLKSFHERVVSRDHDYVLLIQLTLVDLQIVVCFQNLACAGEKRGGRIKSEEAVSAFRIGSLAVSKALYGVQHSTVHYEAVRPEQIGEGTIAGK